MLTTNVLFEGHIATAPDLDTATNTATPVVEFVVLVNRATRDEHGTWIDAQPTRPQVKAYGPLATHTAELEVGTTVLVHGRVETSKWNDRTTGEPRTRDRIIADAIGASLRFATVTVTVTKTERGAA